MKRHPTQLAALLTGVAVLLCSPQSASSNAPERPAETLTLVDIDGSTTTWTEDDLRAMPQVVEKEYVCVGETVGFIEIADYAGVRLSELLREAKTAQAASDYKKRNMYIMLKGTDEYQVIATWYDLETLGGSRALIAIDKNGKPIPPEMGKFRNIFPADKYFGRSVMCIERIEIHVVPGVVEKNKAG